MSIINLPETEVQGLTEIEIEMESIRQKAIAEDSLGKVIDKSTGQLIPSCLTEQQGLIVRTNSFKKWFGNWEDPLEDASMVLDTNGEPLVVYHGAKGPLFDTFDTENNSYFKKATTSGRYKNIGAYFTPSYETALAFTKKHHTDPRPLPEDEDPKRVIAVFLNIRNPKVVGKTDLSFRNLTPATRAAYVQQGYDGIFFKQGRRGIPEYVAFFPNQIKSAAKIHPFDQSDKIN